MATRRKPATLLSKTVKVIQTQRIPLAFGKDHGHTIFVYSNIRTNQIVYSLDRRMHNNRSIKQLPFLGKKTVPAKIRRDMWTPMCVISFPNAYQGLDAFQKLREFRKLHETAYPLSEITSTTGKFKDRLLPKKARGKKLMNQRANSVADMAAVLEIQSRPPTEEQINRAKFMVHMDNRPKAKKGARSKITAAVLEYQGELSGVRIWWKDQLDADFAKVWPKEVEHGPLVVDGMKPFWPPHFSMAYYLKEEELQREIKYKEGRKAPDDVMHELLNIVDRVKTAPSPMTLKLESAVARLKAGLQGKEEVPKAKTIEVVGKSTEARATV